MLGYADVLQGAPVGRRVAVVGAGGIGFDVADFLVEERPEPDRGPRALARGPGASPTPRSIAAAWRPRGRGPSRRRAR